MKSDAATFRDIILEDDYSLAIKIHTTLGEVIIATSYIPPRLKLIPTLSLLKILNLKLPTIFLGDINARHPIFFGTYTNSRGKMLKNLFLTHNLLHLGPPFDTFYGSNGTGRPDIILANSQFQLFHHTMYSEKSIGSDHIPIIFKFQTQPFRIIKQKFNYNKINLINFKSELSTVEFNNLNGKNYLEIDSFVSNIHSKIIKASQNNCPLYSITRIKTYNPTPQVRLKLAQFQAMSQSKIIYGFPNTFAINQIKDQLINLILNNIIENWDELVKIAYQCFRQPKLFWNKINHLRGSNVQKPQYLSPTLETIQSANLDVLPGTKITDETSQADLISKCWGSIFTSNVSRSFNNPNTRLVQNWYNNNKHHFQPKEIINVNILDPFHPIMRPVTTTENNNTIRTIKDKSPGPSGVKLIEIKSLPHNFINAFSQLYDSILCTGYYPTFLGNCNMSFINKPGKDSTNPNNYRPISLLDLIGKIFEKIIATRLSYFLEYHNILSEKLFGFRQ